ncbi:MAG: AAA family ATPase [Bacteroidales bacterium]|jgi:shikimate kinase|nr:AAA family ATPase [Bacteroidales bacterium]
MRVFLVGFMASGKSSIGKKLAKKIGVLFIDLDEYMEEKYNSTIRSLISDKGMDKFREIEKESLEVIINKNKNVLISTGGGTPYYFDNMKLMNDSGVTVYLKVDVPTLVDRLMYDKKDRPLIWGKSREDLTVYANDLFGKREKDYLKAKHTVSGKDFKMQALIDLLEVEN